jgi:hypothetical protein
MDVGSTNIHSLKASYPRCIYTCYKKYNIWSQKLLSNKNSNMFRQISSHYQADRENKSKNKIFPAAWEFWNLEQFVQ